MKLHNLKINAEYANAKLKGLKPFEIRFCRGVYVAKTH